MRRSVLGRVLGSVAFLAVALPASALAQTPPDTTPDYVLHCADCFGTEYFGETLPGPSNGCQNYQHNLFENWTAEGQSAPDPKFIVAAQADIVETNTAIDTDFVYYQIVTRATDWDQVLLKNANMELAFGDCSDPANRYRVGFLYSVDPLDEGSTWVAQGNAKVKVHRDASAGNDRVGDVRNDGPAAPVGDTSDYDSNDDGFETDVNVGLNDVFIRLDVSGGNATIEFAIRRTTATILAVANPFTPCFGRTWLNQTSTISKDNFAINDQIPVPDFSSTSWAIDSCNGAPIDDPCDPVPDCTSSDTECGTASCDPAGDEGNCDLLIPLGAGTDCRVSAGVCDVLEECDGVSTTCPDDGFASGNLCRGAATECDAPENCAGTGVDCPADVQDPADTPCGSASDTICDDPDTCDGAGNCDTNNASGGTLCRADAGECDVAENCDGAGNCPADADEPDGTACGSGADTICDDPDTCDDGECVENNESAATLCRADTGECDVAENCDGNGSCPADADEPDGTSCGSGADTICDDPDTCDDGECVDNNESAATLCRADTGECDVAENCDGNGSCPADADEPDGTSCGSSADTICDDPDTCDDGECVDNNEPGSTLCRADAGQCDVAENCDGNGGCPADGFEADGTACGNPADTICDDPDTCDDGTCEPNNASGSTLCRADTGECDVAENCDGDGSCPADASEPDGTACGSGSDTICDDPDTCDDGECEDNNASGGSLCRASSGECDSAELCDGNGNCPGDTLAPADTPCGSATDTICNNPDTCDGDGNCQPNNEPGSTVCRADAGECDVPESCDGSGNCPANQASPDGTPCGSSADTICDDPDTCDGDGNCDDNNEPGSTLCRTDAGECDVAENCDGDGNCPANGFSPEDTPCGSGTDTICNNPDTCDGDGNCEPNNEPGTTLCRADTGLCDVPENCNGSGSCPADGVSSSATVCRPANGVCDEPENCNGSTATCPGNGFADAGTLCRADAGECDSEETCTGGSASCPGDATEPDGTPCSSDDNVCTDDVCDEGECEHENNDDPCNDGLFCTVGDVCSGGECDGTPRVCDDSVDCTADDCNETLNECTADPDNDFCDDDDPCTADVCNVDTGCSNTQSCGNDICRTAGYWSTHGGFGKDGTGVNVTQAVIDAVGGLEVCGETVTATSNASKPWVEGLGLDSALEGLCVSVQGEQVRQLYRQLMATALNCAISGSDCDSILEKYIDVSFSDCSELCDTGVEGVDGPSINECIEQLDCFNNGGQVFDGVCAMGGCSISEEPCGGGHGNCPGGQVCNPIDNNCHDAALCNEGLGVCPKKASASSVRACREAKGNDCTIDDCF